MLHYYDGRFINDQMFSLFVFNSIERHENNSAGSYFFTSGNFLGQNPPTIEELQDRLAVGDDRYIQVLIGIIPVISRGVSITGGQRHRNLKVGSSIMSLEAVDPHHFL